MKSLDPRVNRLNLLTSDSPLSPKAPLDQFGTYETFVQLKDGKPYDHAGIVHAPSSELAYVFAKEQYSRRLICNGLFVVDTRDVFVTPFSEGDVNIYSQISEKFPDGGDLEEYEFFHLNKRGKQHQHIGSVEAHSYEEALALAKSEFETGKPVYNVWVIKTSDILFTSDEDRIIWDTLPEKKFRDAIDYKAADKIKEYKERTNQG